MPSYLTTPVQSGGPHNPWARADSQSALTRQKKYSAKISQKKAEILKKVSLENNLTNCYSIAIFRSKFQFYFLIVSKIFTPVNRSRLLAKKLGCVDNTKLTLCLQGVGVDQILEEQNSVCHLGITNPNCFGPVLAGWKILLEILKNNMTKKRN